MCKIWNKQSRIIIIFILYICFLGIGDKIFKRNTVLNVTQSEPLGYYWIFNKNPITKGKLYLICLKEKKYNEVLMKLNAPISNKCNSNLAPLIKKIVAGPRDTIRVSTDGIYINNILMPNSKFINNALGVNLYPKAIGYKKQLGNDEYWVMGNPSTSFDSRYFGIISKNEILNEVIKVPLI
ncbi:MAG: S26 family signal peptidase [Burkholderiales bacterium]|nr:S26 family signal peptidase [Burkholderiales bacterium]